jgi:exopolysaccharide biosynthesis polyprenyl glycosylphosphotransferase
VGELTTDALCVIATVATLHVSGVGVVPEGRLALALAIAPLLWVAVFHGFGLYRVLHLAAEDEFRRIIAATSVAVGLLMLVEAWWYPSFSRPRFALMWALALGFELVSRRAWRWSIRIGRRSGELALRTLVIGTNAEARDIVEAIDAPARGYRVIGHVRTDAEHTVKDGPVLGRVSDLEPLIHRDAVDCLFVAASAVSPQEMLHLQSLARRHEIEMRVSANLPGVLTSRLAIQPIHDVMAVSVRPARLTRPQAVLKRAFDIGVSVIAFLLFLPLMAAIAVAIRLTSAGPVIFRQERVTKDGRTFTMLKFRTMLHDPQPASDGKLIDLTEPFFKMRDDPRLTRVGRFLRAASLDELPQLWNVIKGDMSMVGPRPLWVEQVLADPELLAPRHEVRAGITGWWQVNGRSDVDYEDAVRMDLFYIENCSLSLDVYVLLKTLGAVVARKGAY